jgi:hypothetical protein
MGAEVEVGEAAEKVRSWSAKRKPGAKARCKKALSAWLKPCPDTKQEFLRNLDGEGSLGPSPFLFG